MKSKRLFQIFVLLTLLFSPFGNSQPVHASTSSANHTDIQVVDHDLINWGPNYSYTGNVSSSVYENWRFTLPADRKFTMRVTSVVGDLVPLLILLDAHGNELTRHTYTLTSIQPAGDYSIRVQPQSGEGSYHFTIEDILQNQPTVSLVVSSPSIGLGETATVMVKLDHVPAEGYTSMEFTCSYYPNLVEATDIVIADLFGTDPVTAIHGPQYGVFIVAIAGSQGHKVTGSGIALTFKVRGVQGGQSPMECQARVSTGDNTLTRIESLGNNIIVLTPTPTSVSGLCDQAEFVADITVPPGTVMSPGAEFKKTWRLKNVGSCTWTTSYRLAFFSGEQMGVPSSISLPVNIPPGVTVDISLYMTAPSAPGSYRGYWKFQNANGALFGSGPQANQPWSVDIVVSDSAVTAEPTLTGSPTPSSTPGGPTLTPFPPSPTATPTIRPVACDKAEFIADVNVPPGTVMAPNTEFIKTWRLKNVGSCTWTTSYRVQLVAGEQMNAPFSVRLPVNVAPGQTFDISLYMTAPSTIGTHRGYWILHNETGEEFGIGLQGNQPWFVDIVVSNVAPSVTPSVTQGGPTDSPTPTLTSAPTATPRPGTYFDFVAQAYTATWSNAEGQLPYPGLDGDPNGFAFKVDNPRLETGAVDTRPGLLMVPQIMSPQNAFNLYIQASYPPIHVQSGDRFQSMVGCEGGATNCYVGFRLDYQVDGEYPYHPRVFWGPFLERYDGQTSLVNIDLSPLAGKDVKFILTVFADGAASWDRALWVAPIIYRPNAAWTPTPAATPAADWLTFTNRRYSFEFKYPPLRPIIANNDTFATIHLPFVQGTVLQDKSLYVSALEDTNYTCMGGSPLPQSSQNVTINGISFLKQTGQDRGTTYLYRWTSYSTARNNVCVSLNFTLYSLNPGQPATPPAIYDEAAESAIFEQIVGTYRWLETTPTMTPDEPPINTPTPTGTLIPTIGTITGQVYAEKPVTLSLYSDNAILVTSAIANPDGTFSFTAPVGTYLVLAKADGFLGAEGSVTVLAGSTSTMPVIRLPAGDIDGNSRIDPFDVLTIGINYNNALPAIADLNNDGIINVMDLELLARDYRKAGLVPWDDYS